MVFDPNIHHRKSIRLRGYDYAQNGLYFITICTDRRLPIFGAISEGMLNLNEAGEIAYEEWLKTQHIRRNIILHEFVVMPNHVHGIIEIVGADCIRPNCTEDIEEGRRHYASTIGDVIRGYKSAVTKVVRQLQANPGLQVWQRNYYEHVIRNEAAYLKIVDYIQTNPQRWLEDIYYV